MFTTKRPLVAVAVAATMSATVLPGSYAAAVPPPDPQTQDGARGSSIPIPDLDWQPCEDARDGIECATAMVPLDYDDPTGATIPVAMARRPATDPGQRIGSLFLNPGGPGGSGVDFVSAPSLDPLNERFDLVGFDPRGTNRSGNIVCLTDDQLAYFTELPPSSGELETFLRQIAFALVEQTKCRINNAELLDHISTANVARDMDVMRQAVGDDQLNYLGFSYGTQLGATYLSLFPDRSRAVVLDGAIDADLYSNDPVANWFDSSASYARGWETSFDRFLALCASDDPSCTFGDGDPGAAFQALVERLDATPLQIEGFDAAIAGAQVRALTGAVLYVRRAWPVLGALLDQLDNDNTEIAGSLLANFAGDGERSDGLQAILAVDGDWPRDVRTALDAESRERQLSPNFFDVNGVGALDFAFWPVSDDDVFRGPYTNPDSAAPALVIGTTFDNATPYAGAIALTEQLGNARLLTSDGDGHTAYGNSGTCIDDAVITYLEELELPDDGTVCVQDPTYVPGTDDAPPSPATVETTRQMMDTIDIERMPELERVLSDMIR